MRLLLRLTLVALVAFAAGAFLLVSKNPESAFWGEVEYLNHQGLAAQREAKPDVPVILFTGGSSCAFSVDPALVTEDAGWPTFNLGTSAWAGPKYYVHRALQKTKPGDLLVLGIEPNFLTEPDMLEASSLGLALAWREGHPAAAVGADSFGESLSLRRHADLLRPGARYLVTWSAKTIAGGERYYYTLADRRSGGRLQTSRVHPTGRGDDKLHPSTLTPEARDFLRKIAALAGERGVRIAYALPWYFTTEESAAANRESRRHLLAEIATIMPVLKDPALGVRIEPELFSDTNFHLTATGSQQRSRVLGRAVADLLQK